jgi:hypothetical protein
MTSARRLLAAFVGALAVIVLGGILILGRPVDGPMPFPSERPPIARATNAPTATASPIDSSAAPSTVELPNLAPVAPIPSDNGPCNGHDTIIDYAVPRTVATMARLSTSVVIGQVVDVGPGRWNTPDGGPPRREDGGLFPVVRFLRVVVQQSVTGPIVQSPFTVWIPGGAIGCSTWDVGDYPRSLTIGEQFAFFLDDRPLAVPVAGVVSVHAMLSIDAAGRIATPDEGRLTIATFLERSGGASNPKARALTGLGPPRYPFGRSNFRRDEQCAAWSSFLYLNPAGRGRSATSTEIWGRPTR